jgi:hypothetical protein
VCPHVTPTPILGRLQIGRPPPIRVAYLGLHWCCAAGRDWSCRLVVPPCRLLGFVLRYVADWYGAAPGLSPPAFQLTCLTGRCLVGHFGGTAPFSDHTSVNAKCVARRRGAVTGIALDLRGRRASGASTNSCDSRGSDPPATLFNAILQQICAEVNGMRPPIAQRAHMGDRAPSGSTTTCCPLRATGGQTAPILAASTRLRSGCQGGGPGHASGPSGVPA